MLPKLFLVFVGGAGCFFIGKAVGYGLATRHAGVVVALLMGAIWAGYLYKHKDEAKTTVGAFLEFFVSTVIGGFILVALNLA
jgi:hypothetical protein